MNLIIAGTRSLNPVFEGMVLSLVSNIVKEYELDVTLVLSGGANGPDQWGEKWATQKKIEIRQFLPDYETHPPKQAPLVRNDAMALEADSLIAFWDGHSRGTYDIIYKVRNAGKMFFVAQQAFMVKMYKPKSLIETASVMPTMPSAVDLLKRN